MDRRDALKAAGAAAVGLGTGVAVEAVDASSGKAPDAPHPTKEELLKLVEVQLFDNLKNYTLTLDQLQMAASTIRNITMARRNM